jgi:hypothetical protein
MRTWLLVVMMDGVHVVDAAGELTQPFCFGPWKTTSSSDEILCYSKNFTHAHPMAILIFAIDWLGQID